MDPVTHTLVGVTLARAGLDKRTPLAVATLVLAANAPDIDAVAMFRGENFSLACRRGWTHGPLAWLLLPFIVTAAVMAWDRWVRRRPPSEASPATVVLLLAVIGVLSHPMLDWLNTYGIRLLMPFSIRWFRGNSLFIIDPFLWTMLGVGLFGGRIFHADPPRARRIVQRAGALALAYVAMMITLSALGERLGRAAAESRGLHAITDVLYSPRPGTPLTADLVVRSAEGYRFGGIRWLSSPRVTLGDEVIPVGDWDAPAVVEARAVPAARNYLVWVQFPYVRVSNAGADTTVFFGDARYRRGLAGDLSGMQVDLWSVRP
jgi:inner membrane protein